MGMDSLIHALHIIAPLLQCHELTGLNTKVVILGKNQKGEKGMALKKLWVCVSMLENFSHIRVSALYMYIFPVLFT